MGGDAGGGVRTDFARDIARADRVQPALAIVALACTVGVAFGLDGASRALAIVAAVGYAVSVAGSTTLLVPLQRRIIDDPAANTAASLSRWNRGHRVRTALGLASFVLVAMAVLLDAQGAG
jgi:Domain of unknown function (DUF1772)